jgi:hypothetical protein
MRLGLEGIVIKSGVTFLGIDLGSNITFCLPQHVFATGEKAY